jgi:23S rRNA pseudouridine2457 synthase
MNRRFQYILFYKPYGVLSQFTPEEGHRSLNDFGPFPKGVYPVGRLDVNSEGLLLLTDDNLVKHRLAHPRFHHERTYLVQIEGSPSPMSLGQLCEGIMIDGKKTLPAKVQLLDGEPPIPERSVPIRFRKNIPTCWLKITLTEGRNRQVRKMTASVGHPTLRLVRIEISFLSIERLLPGQSRALTEREVSQLKNIVRDAEKTVKPRIVGPSL